jgi:hypothetical protein
MMHTTIIRTEVAPLVYLVSRVTVTIDRGEAVNCRTTHLGFESADGEAIHQTKWEALWSYWIDLKAGRVHEPEALREAADDFVTRIELENTEGVEAPLGSAGRDNREIESRFT